MQKKIEKQHSLNKLSSVAIGSILLKIECKQTHYIQVKCANRNDTLCATYRRNGCGMARGQQLECCRNIVYYGSIGQVVLAMLRR